MITNCKPLSLSLQFVYQGYQPSTGTRQMQLKTTTRIRKVKNQTQTLLDMLNIKKTKSSLGSMSCINFTVEQDFICLNSFLWRCNIIWGEKLLLLAFFFGRICFWSSACLVCFFFFSSAKKKKKKKEQVLQTKEISHCESRNTRWTEGALMSRGHTALKTPLSFLSKCRENTEIPSSSFYGSS